MDGSLVVISVGGSIISPDGVDVVFLRRFYDAVKEYLHEDVRRKVVLVCGGGAPARVYQNAYRAVCQDKVSAQMADWIGIKATHLNGTLVRAVFDEFCSEPLVTDPTALIRFESQVLVAGGWKPGFSTDADAVYLARRFGGKLIINLSNIKKVYTDDPRRNPDARPLDAIGWDDFCKMVGSEWEPGKNTPFDPVASSMAKECGMKVVCADGRDVENTMRILHGESFEGTVIG